MVLISSGEPESSNIYSSACGSAGADFDLFSVCDTWEVVPGSEWRLSKDFEPQTSPLLDVFYYPSLQQDRDRKKCMKGFWHFFPATR